MTYVSAPWELLTTATYVFIRDLKILWTFKLKFQTRQLKVTRISIWTKPAQFSTLFQLVGQLRFCYFVLCSITLSKFCIIQGQCHAQHRTTKHITETWETWIVKWLRPRLSWLRVKPFIAYYAFITRKYQYGDFW